VGRVDPVTGEEIYHAGYVKPPRGAESRPASCDKKSFSEADVKTSKIKAFGVKYLLDNIADSIGLSEALKSRMPDSYERILSLAYFMASSGEPTALFKYWQEKNDRLDAEILSAEKIRDFLLSVTDYEKMLFYKKWAEMKMEENLLALDISLVSSYSELIGAASSGFDREGGKLPQTNICLLMGKESGLPIFQTTYDGTFKDALSFKTSLFELSDFKPPKLSIIPKISIIMDKGFAYEKNINAMLNDKDNTRFMASLPFSTKFAKDLIETERDRIDTPDNAIVVGNDILRVVTRNKSWDNKRTIKAHLFYNAGLANAKKDELYGHVSLLKEMFLSNRTDERHKPDIEKYLQIKKSNKHKSGFTASIRRGAIKQELSNVGWMAVVGNFTDDPKEALEIYGTKYVMEEAFLQTNNFIDLKEQRAQGHIATQNTIFISFISQILIAHIHKVMLEKDLYKKWTMKELFKILQTLEVVLVGGERIFPPPASEHEEIFSAFGFKPPGEYYVK
jgi:hypothetical protein